jgi:hypothetical protein
MPLNAIDYSETIIYKIACKNLSIIDIYVGHTTSFKDRKKSHKQSCKNNKSKLYRMIRENGGWENWEMIEIEKYSCNDVNEAKKRERYWYEKLNAKLNTIIPILELNEILEKRQISHSIYRQEHLEELKEYMKNYHIQKMDENPNYGKENYQKNREKSLLNKKIYRQKMLEENSNFDKDRYQKYKENKLEKYTCSCGIILGKNAKSAHEKTKKHIKLSQDV